MTKISSVQRSIRSKINKKQINTTFNQSYAYKSTRLSTLKLGSKLFHLMFMPIIVPVKIIRLTAFLFSFFVLDNWIKHLVETLTSFLLGNDFVSRSKVNLARFAKID